MNKHAVLLSGLLLVAGLVGHAQAPAQGRGGTGRGVAEATPPAPPPGSAGIYKPGVDLAAALERAMAAAVNGAQSSAPIANTDQYRVNIVHREKPAGALAHPGNTELHYIIEGTGTVVTGGTIVRGTNGATIQDGETHRVQKGDVIIVPAGSAHWYKEVTTPITYLEVRFVAPK